MKINKVIADRNKELHSSGTLFLLLIVITILIDYANPSIAVTIISYI